MRIGFKRIRMEPLSSLPSVVSEQMADAFFADAEDVPRTEAIEAAESAWIGGVADFGDPLAGRHIQLVGGYANYRDSVVALARKHFGERFSVFRYGPKSQCANWGDLANDDEPVAVSLSERMAESFKKFAGNRQDETERVLMKIAATPESLLMIGHPGEQEIVIGAAWISADDVQIVSPEKAVEIGGRQHAAQKPSTVVGRAL